MLGGASFSSVTYWLFKLEPGLLEESEEDFGQAARYLVRWRQLHARLAMGWCGPGWQGPRARLLAARSRLAAHSMPTTCRRS